MRKPENQNPNYYLRMLFSLSLSLGIILWLIFFGPALSDEERHIGNRAEVTLEAVDIVEQTTQSASAKPPPPPAPLPPIEVPDDVEIIEETIELDTVLGVDDGIDLAEPGPIGTGDDSKNAGTPPDENRPSVYIGPRMVRIVTPEYTREARRNRVQALINVKVDIDARGKVQNPKIVAKYLLDGNGNRTKVDQIGYGCEEAALAAASRHVFRPARQDDTPVPSSYTLDMTFGAN